jgi:sugar O-acyltransferase (sialic acid O-acetyltransferase NeuD family)
VHVRDGQHVRAGDLLATLETTKSITDLTAEMEGFVVGLRFQPGDTAMAGDLLCYLADAPDRLPPEAAAQPQPGPLSEIPAGLRITQPALNVARQNQLDLAQLPRDRLVTESMVRSVLEKTGSGIDFTPPLSAFDPTLVFVYGGGGHGKSLIELLRALGCYRIVGVVDDGLGREMSVLGLPVLGGVEALEGIYAQGVRLAVNAVGGIGNVAVRIKIFQRLMQAGFTCPAVVHPTAYVEPSARLAPGVQVFPHAYVGSEAQVGFGSIINTGAIVSHDCNLGDYVNISPGAKLAGAVQVGSGVLIGMGATINLEARIGAGARIGNGATVKRDVPVKGVVRAGTIWPS